jgi:hypothetical protein
VTGAETRAGRLVARLLGLPARDLSAAADVTLETDGAREIWTRRFGRARFPHAASTPDPGTLVERWGPVRASTCADGRRAGFRLAVEGWRIGPCPRRGARALGAGAGLGATRPAATASTSRSACRAWG